jgi:hypothetical protein
VFAVFLVAHMVGDYLFQTDWQARNKRGGLSGGLAFRALAKHVATYTLAFVPGLIWIGVELGAGWALLAGALVALPHFAIDDGRFVRLYLAHVKHVQDPESSLAASVDQSLHVVSLCLVALLIGAA